MIERMASRYFLTGWADVIALMCIMDQVVLCNLNHWSKLHTAWSNIQAEVEFVFVLWRYALQFQVSLLLFTGIIIICMVRLLQFLKLLL